MHLLNCPPMVQFQGWFLVISSADLSPGFRCFDVLFYMPTFEIDMKKIRFSFWIPLLTGEALLFVAMYSGLKLTSDSFLYFEGAEFLKESALVNLFSQKAFLAKPLLYPLFLVPFIGRLSALAVLHHVLFGINYYLSDKVFSIFIKGELSKWVYSLLFATSTALIMVHVFVWTEPLFIMLILLYIVFQQRYFENARGSYLLILIFLGLLISSLRHAGIFFVSAPAFLVLIYIFRNKEHVSLKLLGLANFLLPIAYFLAWQWLVWSIGGNRERIDHFKEVDLIGNYQLISEAIAVWFVLPVISSFISWLIFPLLIAYIIYTIRFYDLRSARWTIFSFLGILAIYLMILFTKGDMIFSDNERYVSVIFPMILMLVISGGERLVNFFPKIKPHLYVISGVLILYNLIRVLKNVWFWSEL